jgi:hypothetical protein
LIFGDPACSPRDAASRAKVSAEDESHRDCFTAVFIAFEHPTEVGKGLWIIEQDVREDGEVDEGVGLNDGGEFVLDSVEEGENSFDQTEEHVESQVSGLRSQDGMGRKRC